MNRLLPAAAVLCGCLASARAFACQYNVRDIGFFDEGRDPYRLHVFIDGEAPPEVLSLLQEAPSTALRESNVSIEIVAAGREKDHPARKFLPAEAVLPAGVLVSPDGQALPVPLARPGTPLRESMAAALQEVVASPARDEILREVVRSFGAVLLVEGPEEAANRRARDAISAAIAGIGERLKELPKPVERPPALVAVGRDRLEREKVLLWSLGLEAGAVEEVRAAIIYGRARWIGPVMKGEEISEGNIIGLFSIVGADCECGLDLSWTLGTRLPVRWGADLQAEAAKGLGFDPESPLVKFEVGRILGRFSSERLSPGREPPAAGLLPPAPVPASGQQEPGPRGVGEGSPLLASSLLAVAGLVVLIGIACMVLFLRAARKERSR